MKQRPLQPLVALAALLACACLLRSTAPAPAGLGLEAFRTLRGAKASEALALAGWSLASLVTWYLLAVSAVAGGVRLIAPRRLRRVVNLPPAARIVLLGAWSAAPMILAPAHASPALDWTTTIGESRVAPSSGTAEEASARGHTVATVEAAAQAPTPDGWAPGTAVLRSLEAALPPSPPAAAVVAPASPIPSSRAMPAEGSYSAAPPPVGANLAQSTPIAGDRDLPTASDAAVDGAAWTVEPGDSFWSIAAELAHEALGRQPTEREITHMWIPLIEANRARLLDRDNPDLLMPGQRLLLPMPSGGAPNLSDPDRGV